MIDNDKRLKRESAEEVDEAKQGHAKDTKCFSGGHWQVAVVNINMWLLCFFASRVVLVEFLLVDLELSCCWLILS